MLRGRIEWLDMFRGVAAILVVLYHFREYVGLPWLEFGFVAVDLFFVLSGVVLGLRYAESIEHGMPFRDFALARLKRLYPMTFIAGLFVVMLDLLGLPSGIWAPASDFGAWTVFLLIPYPSHLKVRGAFPADGPVWSLWAELASNVVWFVAVRLAGRWMQILGTASFLAMLYLAWKFQTLDYGAWQGLFTRFASLVRATAWFSVGYWIAIANPRVPAPPPLLLAVLAAAMAASASGVRPAWLVSVITVGVGSLLIASLRRAAPPGRSVARIARWLGMASFPMYLVHAPAGRLLPLVPGMAHPVALVLVIGTSTVLATLLNEAAMRALHRKKSPLPAPVPA